LAFPVEEIPRSMPKHGMMLIVSGGWLGNRFCAASAANFGTPPASCEGKQQRPWEGVITA